MRRLLPFLALLLVLLPAVPAGAAGSRGPCVVGTSTPRCGVAYGVVPYQANDGDTLDVRFDGGSALTRVRIAGIQAMELSDYGAQRAGECHAVDAATRLDELLDLGGRRVRLSTLDPAHLSRRRELMSAAVKIGGRWIDLGTQLIEEGQALWLPWSTEWAPNAPYSTVSRVAQRLGLQGLWNRTACGPGPADDAQLRVWVSSDPAGADIDALNDEYLTVRNVGPAPVDLSGWWIRDSALHRYTFAAGTVLDANGGYVTVHVGSGADSATDRYWNQRRPIFGNATGDERALGDGGYLFDPQGDLRQASIYPCRLDCGDPLTGKLRITERRRQPESVTITNTSSATVDLFGYRLFNSPYQYAFPAGTVLAPGQALKVTVQGDPTLDTPTEKSWGLDHDILGNERDRVLVQTFDGIDVGCDAWGAAPAC